MVHFFVDLELTTLVVLVLLNLLNGHNFARTRHGAHKNLGESACSTLNLLREFVLLLL